METHNLYTLDQKLFRPLSEFIAEFEKFKAEYSSNLGIEPVDAQDFVGLTLLHHAVGRGRLDVVKFLLEQGANPYIASFNQGTAVDLANKNGKDKILEELQKTNPLQIIEPTADGVVPFSRDMQIQPNIPVGVLLAK